MHKIPFLRLELLSLVDQLFYRQIPPNFQARYLSREMLRQVCHEYFFLQAVAGRLKIARRSDNIIGIGRPRCLLGTGETEASSPAGDGNAALGGRAHAPSTARVAGASRSLSICRD